jgi:hypothetical protein
VATFGVDARSSREVAAAVGAFRLADTRLKRIINQDTVEAFNGQWGRAVRGEAAMGPGGRERARMMRNAGSVKIKGGNPPQALAYQSGQLAKGVRSRDMYGAWEFAGRGKGKTRYVTRSPKGKRYTVNRRTQNQIPPRQDTGYAVYAQFAEFAPRVVSRWVQSIIWTYYEEARRAGVA